MKWTAIVFAVGFATAAQAECPEAALKRECSDKSALTHVFNEHCSGKSSKSEFDSQYCQKLADLESLCTNATQNGVAGEEDGICYTREANAVGTDSSGNQTACYKTVFTASGFGAWSLKTMFPVKDNKC